MPTDEHRADSPQHQPGQQKSLLTTLGKAVAAVLIGLLVIEAALQAAALYHWLRRRHPPQPPQGVSTANGQNVVLCVGDSFTYGVGASSQDLSYPGQLEALLNRETGDRPRWSIINRGWQGRNSAELMQRLPAYLAESQPDYVLILVGANNSWSDAEMDLPPPSLGERAGSDQDPDRWIWKLRTARLMHLLVAVLSGRQPSELAPDLPGPDRAEQQVRTDPIPIPTEKPDTGSAATASPLDQRSRQIIRELHQALRRQKDGDSGALDAAVARANTSLAGGCRIEVATALVKVLDQSRRDQQAVELGLEAVQECGATADLCQHLSGPLNRLGRTEEAVHWAGQAVRLAPDDPQKYRTFALILSRAGQTDRALATLCEAFLIDHDGRRAKQGLRLCLMSRSTNRNQFSAILDRQQMPTADRDTLLELFDQVLGGPERSARLLADHLREMIRQVEAAGGHPVLLTYPKPFTRKNRTIATILDVAEEAGAPSIDFGPIYRQALATTPHEQLYAADGHCNDAGYSIMAEKTAALLLEIATR